MPLDTVHPEVWAPPDTTGRIGPNALLQLIPVLEEEGGPALVKRIFAEGGVFEKPPKEGMIDERPVARVHQALRSDLPDAAPRLAWAAGVLTAEYILARRIPKPAQWLLRLLPARQSARLLARAIQRNAWTFAGSGKFSILSEDPPIFAIADNPVVRGEHADSPICFWHVAVFETLFQRLCSWDYKATETQCCAMGAPACRFELRRDPD